ncbi:MAG: hypothetical protein ACTTIM_00715 [Campylobacter sp.]
MFLLIRPYELNGRNGGLSLMSFCIKLRFFRKEMIYRRLAFVAGF